MVAVPAVLPVTTPEVPTAATVLLLLLHVPQGVASVREVVAPTHALVVPVIAATASYTVVEVLFQRSPASAPPLLFTAFSTPYNVTHPVPEDGAVHGILTTYVVPEPPLPEVAVIDPLCSMILMPDRVVSLQPDGADKVPTLAGDPLAFDIAVTWNPNLGSVNEPLVCAPLI